MKQVFDDISFRCNRMVTTTYSTSFGMATKMLANSIRQDIYNIYGFVRLADEIVDSFHSFDKKTLLDRFEISLYEALDERISVNPILNAFQHTYHKFNLDRAFVEAFMHSMRMDLTKSNYLTVEEYQNYIYGSADVVGLMCLKVFVDGNEKQFLSLKDAAMSLGSAFQKVNFLRDLKADFEGLNRTYFPDTDLAQLDENSKAAIIQDIENDFAKGLAGIRNLPMEARFGVFMAYRYYSKLLQKLKKTPAVEIKNARIRVSNHKKLILLTRSYVKYQLNLI